MISGTQQVPTPMQHNAFTGHAIAYSPGQDMAQASPMRSFSMIIPPISHGQRGPQAFARPEPSGGVPLSAFIPRHRMSHQQVAIPLRAVSDGQMPPSIPAVPAQKPVTTQPPSVTPTAVECKVQSKPPSEEVMEEERTAETGGAETPHSQRSISSGMIARVSLPATPPKNDNENELKDMALQSEDGGQDDSNTAGDTESSGKTNSGCKDQVSETTKTEITGSAPAAASTSAAKSRRIFTEEEIKGRKQAWDRIPMPLDPRKTRKPVKKQEVKSEDDKEIPEPVVEAAGKGAGGDVASELAKRSREASWDKSMRSKQPIPAPCADAEASAGPYKPLHNCKTWTAGRRQPRPAVIGLFVSSTRGTDDLVHKENTQLTRPASDDARLDDSAGLGDGRGTWRKSWKLKEGGHSHSVDLRHNGPGQRIQEEGEAVVHRTTEEEIGEKEDQAQDNTTAHTEQAHPDAESAKQTSPPRGSKPKPRQASGEGLSADGEVAGRSQGQDLSRASPRKGNSPPATRACHSSTGSSNSNKASKANQDRDANAEEEEWPPLPPSSQGSAPSTPEKPATE